MSIVFEDRLSDSPYAERIWRSRCERAGPFLSMALSRWQLVVWNAHEKTYFTVRGPETHATTAYSPEHDEYVGMVLPPGTFMPQLQGNNLVDSALTLPGANSRSFWLHGSAWQFPTYENADVFVERLVREGLLVREPFVDAALQGQTQYFSPRTAERRFLRATGLTQGTVRQIERARYATTLLQQGISILDTVAEAGYYDQPHLTRSLRHFIGQTPTQLSGKSDGEQLSYLYKTLPAWVEHDVNVRYAVAR